MRVSLITPGHNDFLLNFVSATESHSVLISVNNVLFIQFPKLETLKPFLTPLSPEILMPFGWNYCQFCFRNVTQIQSPPMPLPGGPRERTSWLTSLYLASSCCSLASHWCTRSFKENSPHSPAATPRTVMQLPSG